jgi:hypothetical protein
MIIKEISFISIIVIAILFLISHFGKERGWYRKKGNWFSRIMHFSAGFLVGMFWAGFTSSILGIIGLTFAVGVLWEVEEYIVGIFMKKFFGKDRVLPRFDTIEDLICDVLGASIWILIIPLF